VEENDMSLDYALVTSSSLPEKVKVSSNYVSVDREQWLDLVEYSQGLVDKDDSQKILFLIVAKGTAEQENLDNQTDAEESAEQDRLNRLEHEESERKSNLRSKSKSIFNALYGR
tara:strand:- start:4680 stop:5021 length:342 start_codon:yes stop_codon:yes gene_type:complete